jgi:signal transduction histidine kinase
MGKECMLNTSQINILLVDDKKENLLSLETILDELDDLIIHKANSGNEALGKLLEVDFALVLLDVQMPGMDGFEVARLMRGSERTRQVPIIFITAINKEERHIYQGYDSGAVDYLFKPIDADILKSKVRVFIDLYRQKYALEEITHKLEKTISELLESRESLNAAKLEAEKASRIKSDFLTNMSHEIRTPLNGIIGMAELSLMGELEAPQRERVETIKQSGESLLDILNEILDISKIEADKMELESIEFNLREVNKKVIRLLSVKAFQKKIQLISDFDPNLDDTFIGDPVRIRQVLTNLMGNAIKFTEEGMVKLSISLERKLEKSVLIGFSVEDTGIGIPKGKQEKLFEAFGQADTSISRKYGGTGLGLPISKRLVEMMDGQIQVESAENKGSKFWFTLELKKAKESEPQFKKGIFSNGKCLIFDNCGLSCEILKKYLEFLGLSSEKIGSINDLRKNLENIILNKLHYDYLFIDANSGKTEAFDIISDLRREINGNIPSIVFMSDDNSITVKDYLSKQRVENFLLKPILMEDLVKVFKKKIGSKVKTEKQIDNSKSEEIATDLKVLLVEDNLINQRLAQGFIKLNKWSVEIANNGIEAVEKYKSDNFDIVFMDIQMPEKDGFEATKDIREYEKEANIYTPIIAMTAHAMKGYKEICLSKGMDDYVTKPVNLEKIKEVVNRNLKRTE